MSLNGLLVFIVSNVHSILEVLILISAALAAYFAKFPSPQFHREPETSVQGCF